MEIFTSKINFSKFDAIFVATFNKVFLIAFSSSSLLSSKKYCIVSAAVLEIKEYFSLDYDKKDNTFEYYQELTRKTLEESIKYHQISDVEVGSYLSGGVDSSYIVSMAKPDKTFTVGFDKTGFDEGELRPEYYYNCVKRLDDEDVNVPVRYTKFDENGKQIHFDIEYTIAANQTITINTEASDVFTSDILRDITEMIDAVKKTIEAHNKLDEITKMKGETQYASDEYQGYLKTWYDAVKKEADYFEDNLQKLFDTEVGKIDEYYATITLGITDLGCKKASLELTEKRVGESVEIF